MFSDQVYSLPLNLIPSPCFVLSEDLCLIDTNTAFQEFIGKSEDHCLGVHLEKLVKEKSLSHWKPTFDSELKQGFISTFIAKGEQKSATCTLQKIQGSEKLICCLKPLDKESSYLLLEANSYFQDILNNSSTWFWHIREDYSVCELSENFQQVTGMNPAEVLNQSIFNFLESNEGIEGELNLKNSFKARESFQGLISSFICHEKRHFVVTTNAQPFYNSSGLFAGFIGCTQDISEEYNVKKDLQVALNNLENSNENLEQFAIMASHDLQEPARLIHSYVQLIALDETNQLSDKSAEFLGFLKASSDRMRSLIHNILDYSNLRSEGQEKEWFSTSEIVSLSMLSCTKIIHESDAEIKCENLPECLFCYPSQMTRVFQNVFSNSIKFARPFETPIIEITATEHPDHVEMIISDNGIGIAAKDRSTVFKMFTSLHSKTKYKGNGIGMNIVKKIIDNHRGTVTLSDSHLGGTTISITLPLPN